MRDYEIIGPFTGVHYVAVDGWRVPFLQAFPANGGKIHLTLDDCYGLDLAVADADRFIPWIADCIAVAMGYTCHPRADWDAPRKATPFWRMHAITSVVTRPAAPPDDDPLAQLEMPDGN